MNPRISRTVSFSAAATLMVAAAFFAPGPGLRGDAPAASAGPGAAAQAPGLGSSVARMPVHFEPNLGQTDPRVRFLGRAPGLLSFFTPDEVVLKLGAPRAAEGPAAGPALDPATAAEPPSPRRSHVLRLRAKGAALAPRLTARGELPGTASYVRLDGRPSVAGVPRFAELRYEGIYPGIDQVFHGRAGTLEYDFVVAPGADPASIELVYEGAETVSTDDAGSLIVETSAGALVQPPPVVFQEAAGVRRPVGARYRLTPGEPRGVAFELAAYDPRLPLVIDPQVVFRNCIGGTSTDWGRTIAVTPNGQAYIGGDTYSTDFPTHAGAVQPADNDLDPNSTDGFVAKLNLQGTAFPFATYVGGAKSQQISGIDLDASNNVYVAGITDQANSTPEQVRRDAFVLKMDSTLSTLFWSRIFGGGETDAAIDLVVNPAGDAFVSGYTRSPDFCTAGLLDGCGIDAQFAGISEGFAVKFNRHGAVRYATLLGGADLDSAEAIDLDAADRAYVVVFAGDSNPWVTRINAAGTAKEYTRVLPGSGLVTSIAVDDFDQAYVTGLTADPSFYTTPGAHRSPPIQGPADGFVTALRANGTCCLYSTLLGDSRWEYLSGIAVDFRPNAYVVGTAIPEVGGVLESDLAQVVVARLNAYGTGLVSQQFLGGSGADDGEGIDLDDNPATFVVGITDSWDFAPGVSGCANPGTNDDQAFVVKLQM